jgi:uroporphyrin-3 C-methyltransferase
LSAEPEPRVAPQGPLPRPARWPALLALLAILALLALVVVGQLYWRVSQQDVERLRQSIAQAQTRQRELARRVQESNDLVAEQQERLLQQEALIHSQVETIGQRERELAAAQERLGRQEEAVSRTLANLHQEVGRSGQEWRAGEAAFLVELAQQRLRLACDLETAQQALKSADRRLRETGDPRWMPVRDLLAADLARLSEAGLPDLDALAKTLLGMASGVNQLPLRPQRSVPRAVQPTTPVERVPGPRNLDTLLRDGWEGLKSLVKIRRNDQPQTARRGPQSLYNLRQNLRLQLDMARFALLRRDVDLYATRLDAAQTWLTSFFDSERPEVRLYLQELARLRSARLRPDLPDLGPTLAALRARLDAPAEQTP